MRLNFIKLAKQKYWTESVKINCKDCIFFNKYEKYDYINSINICKKFLDKDLITGEIINISALNCRKDNNKCGEKGKYFITKFIIGL